MAQDKKGNNLKMFIFDDKVTNLIILNLLWFVFTIIGFGLLTLFPATYSLYIIINSGKDNKGYPLHKTFFKIFNKDYWRLEKIAIVYFLVGLILFFSFRVYYLQITNQTNFINTIGLWVTGIFILIYLLSLIHVFLVCLYFPKFKTWAVIKHSLMLTLSFPLSSLFIIVIGISILVLIIIFPYIFPLIFVILVSLYIMLILKIMKPKYQKLLPDRKPLIIDDYL